MRRFGKAACFAMVAAFSARVFADFVPPVMPEEFKAAGKTDGSGVTWRQTGTLFIAPTNAVATLDAALAAQGYSLVHLIETSEEPNRRLVFWSGRDADVLAMLWTIDESSTGMRWGFTLRAPENASVASAQKFNRGSLTNSTQSVPNNKSTKQ